MKSFSHVDGIYECEKKVKYMMEMIKAEIVFEIRPPHAATARATFSKLQLYFQLTIKLPCDRTAGESRS